ncbi:GIY-YIG nuclease family protein [Algoriphagus vanfongensis]|uniref:GIY-YIG nuclease family protein n=1 Tax=Algoriphagus vanfongensis TaxID=426371 RepID=UPI00040B7F47|nr:GIY-YIG nuclease family protein [Algoriphagus vanfongensis]
MKKDLNFLINKKRNEIVNKYKSPITDKKVLEFIKHHKLDQKLFYNASGKKISEIFGEMHYVDAIFAYNTTPCKKGNHTIRDRNNHCLICRTANIAFQKRYHESGYLYIAGSMEGKLIKIGITNNIEKRKYTLKKTSYANQNDWEIIYFLYTKNVGLLEYLCSCKLVNHITKIQYSHAGKLSMAKEIFYCSFKKALKVVLESKNDSMRFLIQEETFYKHKSIYYNFRNLEILQKRDLE